MGHKLKVGDRVKLSAHALKLKAEVLLDMVKSRWRRGVKRNSKDTYIIQGLPFDGTFVTLGRRTGKWYQRREGPLTGYSLKRDWVKRAD